MTDAEPQPQDAPVPEARPLHETKYSESIDEHKKPTVAHDTHEKPHVVSAWLLVGILLALLFLTFLTYAVTWVDFGSANIWVALGIAVLKAVLVGAFFMHLYWDAPFNGLIVMIALVFVAIFISFSLLDTGEYQKNTVPPSGATISTSSRLDLPPTIRL